MDNGAQPAGNGKEPSAGQSTPIPTYAGDHESRFSSAWGCAGCVLVILLAIGAARWWSEKRADDTLVALAPADTLLYVEASSLDDCLRWLSRLGAMSEEEEEKLPAEVADTLALWLANRLADFSTREARQFLAAIESAAVVWARGDSDLPTWMVLVKLRSTPPAPIATTPSTAGQTRIFSKDGAPIYTAQVENITVFSPDAGLVRFAQQSRQQPERTLADLAAQAKRDRRLPWALISCQAAECCRAEGESSGALAELVRRLPSSRKIYWMIAAHEGDNGEQLIAVRTLQGSADAKGGASIFGWLLRIFGWAISIPLVALGILASLALLMAACHYTLRWWYGRLSPRQPPHRPNLPPALAEDLGSISRSTKENAKGETPWT